MRAFVFQRARRCSHARSGWAWRWSARRRWPSARRSPTCACSATSAPKSRRSAPSPGVSIGDTLEMDTLDMVRERLNTTGLFADVNVWWEQHKTGVRVNIAVKDKFPWAPVPTGSWSANNKSFGLLFVHGNLFGRGKQLLLGGRLATVDSGAALAYRDPSSSAAGSTGSCRGTSSGRTSPSTSRTTPARTTGPTGRRCSPPTASSPRSASPGSAASGPRSRGAWSKFNVDDDRTCPWTTLTTTDVDPRARQVGIGQGVRVVRLPRARVRGHDRHLAGRRLRLRAARLRQRSDLLARRRRRRARHQVLQEPQPGPRHAAGPSERTCRSGWRTRRADRTCAATCTSSSAATVRSPAHAEYHFPLFSISSLDFRALGFYDIQAIWFGAMPPPSTGPGMYAAARHARPAHASSSMRNGWPQGPGFVLGARPPPVGGRRAALLPPLGRGAADRVRRRLGPRVADLALHAHHRRLTHQGRCRPASRRS